MKRILILAGSGEAVRLTAALAERPEYEVIASFAGRTAHPLLPPNARVRIGGFGGVDGLAAYLAEQAVDAVIDATHPFAARMHANAAEACMRADVPLLAIVRPPWEPTSGDRWHEAEDMRAAAALASRLGRRIFLTIGRQELAPFAECVEPWFLIRSIEPPNVPLPPRHELLLRRGPFTVEEELALLREREIDLLVSKNSGGSATDAKLIAARERGLAIVLVRRPLRPCVRHVATAEAALLWLNLQPAPYPPDACTDVSHIANPATS